jgi:hypothetical protein
MRVRIPLKKAQEEYLRVSWVHRDLVFCRIADEPLVVRKRDVRRGGAVTLVVGDDLDTIVLPDADAAIK